MPTPEIKIWDLFVRVFHWSVVLLFMLDFWLVEDNGNWSLHRLFGYAIAGLVLMRIIWGFIGPHTARFASFFPTPQRLKRHINDLKQRTIDPREGHNPMGGAMVILLLTMLLVITMSGWMQTWDMFWGEEWLEEFHQLAANITMGLVAIHVAAVVMMTKVTGLPLLRTMLTGKRPGLLVSNNDSKRSSK
ncbi:MAG TPA: cytochrome b/b6 domain-containing protein [Thiolinea sp.]|nr:cytochrome b/b6 domain-containing protein [Thiolinea sp.]